MSTVEALTPDGQRLFDDMPPYFEGDHYTLRVMDVFGAELARIQTFADDLRTLSFPQNATDELKTLSILEASMNLPVAPGLSDGDRRARVLSHLRRRNAGSGLDWQAAVASAVGQAAWSYIENTGDYQVTIEFPFSAGIADARQIEEFIREITPAHIELQFIYGTGFILGTSQLGIDAL